MNLESLRIWLASKIAGRDLNVRGGERVRLGERTKVAVIRANGDVVVPEYEALQQEGFYPGGFMNFEQSRGGHPILVTQVPNLVVNQGKNDILDVYFSDGTQTAASSWFMGLITDSGFTGIVAGDTAASHAGWSEFTGYSEATRPVWGQGDPASQAITNSTPVTFNINASGTVRGGFIITQNTKGGTSGKLWAAALFSSPVTVNNGDQLKVTYNLSC
jgi:hypothetical protein